MIPALIVPTLTRIDLLWRMLASVDCPVGDLVIIDNGANLEGRAPLAISEPLPTVARRHIVTLPSNLGVAGAWNLGIKSTPHADWWLIANDDVWFPPGALAQMAAAARRDALVLSMSQPPWACFALGDDVVQRVGLFDERFHPAYFEDNDYEDRCRAAGAKVVDTSVLVMHDNSSTLAAGGHRNDETFQSNGDFLRRKRNANDLSWSWDLRRRRSNCWEK